MSDIQMPQKIMKGQMLVNQMKRNYQEPAGGTILIEIQDSSGGEILCKRLGLLKAKLRGHGVVSKSCTIQGEE